MRKGNIDIYYENQKIIIFRDLLTDYIWIYNKKQGIPIYIITIFSKIINLLGRN